jgi:hypothetical protein
LSAYPFLRAPHSLGAGWVVDAERFVSLGDRRKPALGRGGGVSGIGAPGEEVSDFGGSGRDLSAPVVEGFEVGGYASRVALDRDSSA